MIVYCTYCSAEKNNSKLLLPTIERYKSIRINTVFNLAKTEGLQFIILSGKYGILEAEQEIGYYDHLLMESEVKKHANLIAKQLKSKNITKIVFYMNSIARDKNLKSYLDCITIASAKSGAILEIKESNFND